MLPAVKKPGEVIGHTSALTTQLLLAPEGSGAPAAPAEDSFFLGVPPGKPVYVPMGDHPCSVMAALAQQQSPNDTNLTRTFAIPSVLCYEPRGTDRLTGFSAMDTVVNIGTSAQLAIVLSTEDLARLPPPSTAGPTGSFEVRPFLFGGRFIGVAASLNGCVSMRRHHVDGR